MCWTLIDGPSLNSEWVSTVTPSVVSILLLVTFLPLAALQLPHVARHSHTATPM